ncbi:MAG TPA: trypsin-like peptidase domain-containing protein, partial [Pyrinomonadaceae bacterium]|nr:trypsin-like peptidase domain-containing protein [Pyrinomonadaceae bacterium]
MKRHLPHWLAVVLLLVVCAGVQAQETLPELVHRVKPSVVSSITYDSHGDVLMSGSGFFARANQVITNLHVIAGAQRAAIRTLDGKGRTYPVTGILGVDEEGDLAVLGVNMPEGRARPLEVITELPEEGESVFVIGNPLRLEGSVSNGIVSAVREVPGIGKILQITAPVSHGNSGSPVFNMKGQVIGVVTIRVTNGENINLALGAGRVNSLRAGAPFSFEQLAARTRLSSQTEAVAELWYRNGLDSLWLGNYENALANFENAVNRNPRRAEAWIQVGYCKVKQGRNA